MNKAIVPAFTLALLTACAGSDTKQATTPADSLTASDRKAAQNDDRGHRPQPMTESRLVELLEEYNANGDETLTWAEYNDWRRARFDDTDANSNGTVDTEEYVYEFEGRLDLRIADERKGHVTQTEMRFNALDKDKSEWLEWAEMDASGERIFARWDGNKDGVIDASDPEPKSEWQARAANGSPEQQAERQERQRRARRAMIRMPTTHNLEGVMKLYDANEDQAVSRTEFDSERRSAFHLADEDKNGLLSFDEYLSEYEDRLDTAIASRRRASIKQTYIRFGILDDNDDQAMTFDEFQISAKRIFTRWDKNADGVISRADIGQ